MADTKIEWTDLSWNPVTGCGPDFQCWERCYARRMATRLAGRCGYPADEPFRVTLHPERLIEPLRWRKPRRIFVCSMGDLFHKDVPYEYIDRIMAVVALCAHHTFMVLTKRPERMAAYLTKHGCLQRVIDRANAYDDEHDGTLLEPGQTGLPWPLPNLWLGATVENQPMADERLPHLRACPAAVRFISYEPALGPLDMRRIGRQTDGYSSFGNFWDFNCENNCEWRGFADELDGDACPICGSKNALVERDEDEPGIDWVVAGGETGPKARPAHPDWFRTVRDQCAAAGIPFFFKQWGEWVPRSQVLVDVWPKALPSQNFWRLVYCDGHTSHDTCGVKDEALVLRIGKPKTGRLLDGREHSEFPRSFGR